MVEDIINTLPYYKVDKQQELIPIVDDSRAIEDKTEKQEKRTLNIVNNFSENDIEFLDGLKYKNEIKIPGKDRVLQTVDIIGLHYTLKLSPEELKDKISRNPFKSIQPTISAQKATIKIPTIKRD